MPVEYRPILFPKIMVKLLDERFCFFIDSTCSVAILPESSNDSDDLLSESDLKFEFMRDLCYNTPFRPKTFWIYFGT
jgi:hypothetical protein